MIDLKKKQCLTCDTEYQPTGRRSKYCSTGCKPYLSKEYSRSKTMECRIRQGKNVGVGKGNANTIGLNDSQYKTGIARFKKSVRLIKITIQFCERCNKDLANATKGYWCVHHKDHDRTNNNPENWELLCKKCHQLEHECWKNLNN
jgi:hypothetical protein